MTVGELTASLTIAASKKGELMAMEVTSIEVDGNNVHLSFVDENTPSITITWGD